MIRDVLNLMGTYVPVFFNPAEVPWEEVSELRTQHEAFFHAMKCMERNDFSKDFTLSDETLVERLSWFYERMIILEDWVNHWCANFEFAEELATQALEQQLARDFIPQVSALPSAAASDPNALALPSDSRSAAL